MRVGGHKAGGRDSEINVTWISRKQQLLEGLGDALSREATSVNRQHMRGAREKPLLFIASTCGELRRSCFWFKDRARLHAAVF